MNVEYIIGAWVIIFIFVALFGMDAANMKKGRQADSSQFIIWEY
ncbi:MAG: hypothetical protein ACFNJM_01390 [Selenomonas artemidis]